MICNSKPKTKFIIIYRLKKSAESAHCTVYIYIYIYYTYNVQYKYNTRNIVKKMNLNFLVTVTVTVTAMTLGAPRQPWVSADLLEKRCDELDAIPHAQLRL